MKSNLALSIILLFGLMSCSYLAKADGMLDDYMDQSILQQFNAPILNNNPCADRENQGWPERKTFKKSLKTVVHQISEPPVWTLLAMMIAIFLACVLSGALAKQYFQGKKHD